MFWKMKFAFSPLLSSAVGGATAAMLTMLGAEKRLMQASLAAFLYYAVQVPVNFHRTSPGRGFAFRSLLIISAPIFLIGLEKMPAVTHMYRLLVQNSAFMFCISEALSVIYLSIKLSETINQSVWELEITTEINWLKYSVLGAAVTAYSLCLWIWASFLWAGFPPISQAIIYYIAIINIPIITLISVIDERGSIVDGAIGSMLITYCAWVSGSVSPLHISTLTSMIFGNGNLDMKPIIAVAVGVVVTVIAVAVYLDSDTPLSDTVTSEYLLEIEPFVKACLILIGTNLLCVMAGYDSEQWHRFRLAEACIIPIAYWLFLSQKPDDSI